MNQYFLTAAATTFAMAGLMTAIAQTPSTALQPSQTLIIAQSRGLAKQLQGKPVVVAVHASWCPKCKTVAPVLSQLQQQYSRKASFVSFDVSDRGSSRSSQIQAQQLGLSSFLQSNKSQTGLVAIVDPATGDILQQFRGNGNLKDYQNALQQAIKQVR
jgi:thiol-disulfide isomerase/thioredoxin